METWKWGHCTLESGARQQDLPENTDILKKTHFIVASRTKAEIQEYFGHEMFRLARLLSFERSNHKHSSNFIEFSSDHKWKMQDEGWINNITETFVTLEHWPRLTSAKTAHEWRGSLETTAGAQRREGKDRSMMTLVSFCVPLARWNKRSPSARWGEFNNKLARAASLPGRRQLCGWLLQQQQQQQQLNNNNSDCVLK